MSTPLVSIVIPTINRRALLGETVDSIRAQTVGDWEAIICDDGSTDDTVATFSEMAKHDPRVRVLQRTDNNKGAPTRRNQGFDASSGRCVIFLDDDDLLDPKCLEHRLPFMESDSSLDFAVFPCLMFVDKVGDEKLLWNAEKPDDTIERFLRLDVPWQTTGPIWRRESLVPLGPWVENLPSWQDWEFHMRALVRGFKYKWVPEIDFYYRLGRGKRQKIGANALTPKHLLSREPMLTRILHLMRENGAMTPRRENLVVGLFFWVAQGLANRELRHEAVKVWNACRREGLIGAREHVEGVMYFRFGQIGRFRGMMKKYLIKTWPADHRFVFDNHSTFMNAPLPPGGGASWEFDMSSSLPKITIVTTSYNQKQYLEEAITSVLDQKYPNLEYIICDGASKDGSVDLIKKYEKHLASWYSKKDGGQPNALNNGFGQATGDVFGFINSDDVLLPGALHYVAEQFQRGSKWIVGWVKFVEPDNSEWPQLCRTIDSPVDWFTSNPLPQQSTFWLGDYTRKLGPFRTDLQLVFDYEFWMRMHFVGKVDPQIVRHCMGTYRLHETSKTVSLTGKYPAEFKLVRDEYDKFLTAKQRATVDRFYKTKKNNVYREAALKGLNTGDVKGARKNAMKLLAKQAGSVESWRVAFHAIKGS